VSIQNAETDTHATTEEGVPKQRIGKHNTGIVTNGVFS
jgi:hypothetical protein